MREAENPKVLKLASDDPISFILKTSFEASCDFRIRTEEEYKDTWDINMRK